MKGGSKGSDPKYPISFRNTSIPTAIHAVFKWDPHGTYYAAISHIVTEDIKDRNIVPHMVYILILYQLYYYLILYFINFLNLIRSHQHHLKYC